MSTKVQYGDVVLENVTTRRWDQTVEFDESNTDQIGVRYHLTFDAVIHQQASPVTTARYYVDDGSVYANPAQRFVSIKDKLLRHRQELKVWFGDTLVLNAKPITGQQGNVDGRTDINNGPRPEGCEVHHIASDRVFRIRFSVSAVLRGCQVTYADGDSRFAINNRWSVRETMDENHRITRHIAGTLRLAGSPTSTTSLLPHAFRSLCFPGLEDGFKRLSVGFQAEKTGNALNYEIIDQQGRYAPPYPATHMDATHSTETNDGITFFTGVQVRLVGPPHCDVRQLIQRAVQICQYRLNYEDVAGAAEQGSTENSQLIVHASIAESINGEYPECQVQMRVQELYEYPRVFLGKMLANKFGTLELPPLAFLDNDGQTQDVEGSEYQVNKFPMPALWGSDEWAGARSPLALTFLRNVLQSNCGGAQAMGSPGSGNDTVGTRYNGERYNDTTVTADPDASYIDEVDPKSTWSDKHLDSIYLTVSQASRILWDQPMVALPVANHAGGSAQQATLVALSGPVSKRVVEVDFERYGKEPELPPWQSHQIGQANLAGSLLSLQQLPARPSSGGEGMIYRTRATYEYLADREVSRTAEVPIGRLPHVADSAAPNTSQLGQVFNESLPA